MQCNQDQREMLAALLDNYRDPNRPISGAIHYELAVVLRWSDEKAKEVHRSLYDIGALTSTAGFSSPSEEGRRVALEELATQKLRKEIAEKYGDQSRIRREWTIALVCTAIGAGLTLLFVYLGHIWGWNK